MSNLSALQSISSAFGGKTPLANLSSNNFDLEEFVHSLISNASYETINSQLEYFQSAKQTLATDIQRNVHSNYNDFVSISNQIRLLEKDLSELREILGKVRSEVFSHGQEQQPQVKHTEEVDIDQVDGLAAVSGQSGRELLGCFHAVHLNNDDFSLGRQCQLFLFSGLLVMAYKKKKVYVGNNYEVEKSWAFATLELKSAGSHSEEHLLCRLQHLDDKIVFRFDTVDSKRSFLFVLKKAVEECAKGTEAAPDLVLPETLTSVGDLSLGRSYIQQRPPSQETTNPELAWIRDMPDELDVFIAHREYDKAIQCVDRAKMIFTNYGTDNAFMVLLNRQLEKRIEILYNLLTKDLKNIASPAVVISQSVLRLTKLGLGMKARDLYFKAKSQILRMRLTSLPFEGDVISYVHDLTFLFFSLVKKIIRKYRSLFPSPELSSGLIAWLNDELENYWVRFRCQVFYEDQDFAVITECLSSAKEGCGVLREVGVEFGHVFEIGSVKKDIVTSLEWLRAKVCAEISKGLADDEFTKFVESGAYTVSTVSDGNIELKKAKITSSVFTLQKLLLSFIFVELQPILVPNSSFSYYTEIINAISSFFELYSRHILELCNNSRGMTDKNVLVALVDLSWLCTDFLPFIQKILETVAVVPTEYAKIRRERNNPLDSTSGNKLKNKKTSSEEPEEQPENEKSYVGFQKPIVEWVKLNKRLEAIITLILTTYSIRRSKELAKSTYAFGPGCVLQPANPPVNYIEYSSDAYPLDEGLVPHESVIVCLKELYKLETAIKEVGKESLRLKCNETLIGNILECFFKDMTHDSNWVSLEHGYDRIFQYTGWHQLVLDIQFMLKNMDVHLTDLAIEKANDVSTKATKMYFKRLTDEQKKRTLKSGEWFENRITAVMSSKKIKNLEITLRGF